MFLTTNRIHQFDPAFESRVTVALRYEHLEPSARSQIWKNLISKLKVPVSKEIDYKSLGETVMNGRQIKNAVRLAVALSQDAKRELNMEFIQKTLSITALGREDMARAEQF